MPHKQLQQEQPQQNYNTLSLESDQTAFANVSDWQIMDRQEAVQVSQDEVRRREMLQNMAQTAPEFTYQQQAAGEEHKYKLPKLDANGMKTAKKMVKDNSRIRDHFAEKTLYELAEWSYASSQTTDTSTEYQNFTAALWIFQKSHAEYETALRAHEAEQAQDQNKKLKPVDNAKMLSDLTELVALAEAYLSLHNGSHPVTDKGKNRKALTQYVLSSKFVEKHLIPTTDADSKLSRFYSTKSYIFEKTTENYFARFITYADDAAYKPIFDRFVAKYANINTKVDSRRQFSSIFNGDEAHDKKVIEAMDKASQEPADMEPLMLLMDDSVSEILKFSFSPEIMEEDYLVKHPLEAARLINLGMYAADWFKDSAIYGSVGVPYLTQLQKTHPDVYMLLQKKIDALSSVTQLIENRARFYLSVKTKSVKENIYMEAKNFTLNREYVSVDDPEPESEHEALRNTFICSFDECLDSLNENKMRVYDKVTRAELQNVYSFKRQDLRARINHCREENEKVYLSSYDFAKQTNQSLNEDDLRFMKSAYDADGATLVEYYLPAGSAYRKDLEELIKADTGMEQVDLASFLGSMLKAVKFDMYGDPLPEYKDHHNWNIHWLDGYKKALRHPKDLGMIGDYNFKFDASVRLLSKDAVKKFEELCAQKDFEKDGKHLQHFLYMASLSAHFVEDHVMKSRMAQKRLEDKEIDLDGLQARAHYINALAQLTAYQLELKYQCNILTKKFEAFGLKEDDLAYQVELQALQRKVEDAKIG